MITKLMQTPNLELAAAIESLRDQPLDPEAFEADIPVIHPETLTSHVGFPEVAPDPAEFEEATPVELDRDHDELD